MTGAMRVPATVAIFVTMLALVALRPRRWNEAWWTVSGALAMLGCGFVSLRQAIDTTLSAKNALLFLLSLLLLSLLVGKSGFFEWAAVRCAGMARGNARALYRNAFLLGALVTVTLSLDTTAVMLTPVVLALVRRLKLPALPYIALCAFVANIASLLLPISNLTNILCADTFHLSFAAFAGYMLLPQLVALALTYGLLRLHHRRDLPESFQRGALPDAGSVVESRPYFVSCVSVLAAVLLGYFVAPLFGVEAYAVAFAGCAVLMLVGRLTSRFRIRALAELSWSVFPFVIGLFIAVRGLENLGLVGRAAAWLQHAPPGAWSMLQVAGATSLAANVMNNLPAALIARSALSAASAHTPTVLAALIGVDAGPMITPFGSLATMLVLTLARQDGVEVRARSLLAFALWTTPLIVLGATLALCVSTALTHAR
jgi:arsenical pump membrane protein